MSDKVYPVTADTQYKCYYNIAYYNYKKILN